MKTLRNILFAFAAALTVATTSAGQTEDKASQNGILVVRNGSEFATLSVTVYRLESDTKSPVKEGVIPPTTSQLYTLPTGDYLATFAVSNGTAALSEGRFSLGAGEDYTINFQPKGKP